MLIWRALAARELAARWGEAMIPAISVVVSSLAMWFLLTVLATALAQQPKVRRRLLKDVADYSANAVAKAYARETAQALGTAQSSGSAERVGGRPT